MEFSLFFYLNYLALTETVRHAPHGDSAANDTQQDAVDATQSEPPSLTADAYRTAFTNIANDVVTTQDSLVLTTMLRSADTDQLDDGLMLTMKLSVSSTKNKVCIKLYEVITTSCFCSHNLWVVTDTAQGIESCPSYYVSAVLFSTSTS